MVDTPDTFDKKKIFREFEKFIARFMNQIKNPIVDANQINIPTKDQVKNLAAKKNQFISPEVNMLKTPRVIVNIGFNFPFEPPIAKTIDVYSTSQQKLKYPTDRSVLNKKIRTIKRLKGEI